MSQLQRLTPSGKTGGYEGIKSSINNSKLDHRQELNKTYFRCENNLLDWFISNNYDKLLQLNPAQLFKDQVAYVIRTNNPFQLQLTDELVFKSILAAHTKAKRIIENLYYAKESEGEL